MQELVASLDEQAQDPESQLRNGTVMHYLVPPESARGTITSVLTLIGAEPLTEPTEIVSDLQTLAVNKSMYEFPPGSEAHAAFREDFVVDVAGAAGIAPELVVVEDVHAKGTKAPMFVRFRLVSKDIHDRDGLESTVASLIQQVEEPESQLLQGKITQDVVPYDDPEASLMGSIPSVDELGSSIRKKKRQMADIVDDLPDVTAMIPEISLTPREPTVEEILKEDSPAGVG